MIHITAKHKKTGKAGDFYYKSLAKCIEMNGKYFEEFREVK